MANEKFILYKEDKPFVAGIEEGYQRNPNHKYAIYGDKPPIGFISQASEIITRNFFDGNLNQTLKEWRKDKKLYNINWPHFKTGEIIKSKGINYLTISEELRKYGKFDCEKFNLPPLGCLWLDTSLDMSINYHFFDPGSEIAMHMNDGTTKQQYGDNYPITPRLDREGHIFTTFQPTLLRRIIKLRNLLVNDSDKALFSDWVLDVRTIINDCISLIDINLNQLYTKAEYSPEPSWTFDKEKLGEKNNRRLKDKLKWVRQISGNNLDIEVEMVRLNKLKSIRNHLNHFDPPTLVITIEEAVQWLNDILYIGQIIIKIRKAIGVPISLLVLEFICQKEVVFVPEPVFSKRLPLKPETGYYSSVWPKTENEQD
jgi:hypothetical protein